MQAAILLPPFLPLATIYGTSSNVSISSFAVSYTHLALVDEQYHYVMEHFCQAQDEFAELPAEEQPDHVGEISVDCMLDVLLYAQNYPEEFQLLLCCAEGTRYAGMIDEMVEIEVEATHRYQESLDSCLLYTSWRDDRISILYSGEPEAVWGCDRRSGRIFSGNGRACNVYRNFSDLHWEVADGDYMGTAFYDARQP